MPSHKLPFKPQAEKIGFTGKEEFLTRLQRVFEFKQHLQAVWQNQTAFLGLSV